MEVGVLLGTGPHTIHCAAFWKIACSHFFETLLEDEFKSNEPVNSVEEILRLHNVREVAWVFLAAFGQIYRAAQEDLQSVEFLSGKDV